MNTDLKQLVKTFVADYIMYHYPQIKIKKNILFDCPFKHNHSSNNNKPSCKIYPNEGYKVICYCCGDLGNIFDLVRKIEPDMTSLNNDEIAEYIVQLLNIKTNAEIDRLLETYANSGFYLIPLQPNSKDPIQKESWKKNTTNDSRKWREWIDAGLGLGLVSGRISKIICLDIDDDETYAQMKEKLNETLTQTTRRGHHFIWEYDDEFDFLNHCNFRKKGFAMELRVNNSYIAIAPSKIENTERFWNDKKISKMPDELKKFLLNLLDKNENQNLQDQDEIIKDAIQKEDLGIKDGLRGLDGQCNDTWIKLGGILRKQLNPNQVEFTLQNFNKLLADPMDHYKIKSMCQQLSRYDVFDKKDLAKEILAHLQLESVRFANTLELSKSLGYSKKDIENILDYLVKEQKVQKIGRQFKALNKVEWDTNFMGLSKPLNFDVPYFEKYVKFENSSMVIIGAKTGAGKTHLAMNFIKEFVDKKVTPYYVCTEAGSKFSLIGASLGLKEGDYKFKIVPDATSVEFEDNSVIICDWVRPQDYSKTDLLMENLNNQLIKHGGLLIAMVQLRKDGSFFAPDLFDFFASLVATYNWTEKFNEKTKETVVDNENTYLKTTKIRDSKTGIQYITIPTHFDRQTKRIKLRQDAIN